MAEQRRDPELLLKKLQKESRGKLTVFLGAAAGVGKTYAMLENAHERLNEGIDVVVGWVETHKRKETEEMLQGLPIIAARQIEYREKILGEMDLDAVLARKPQLVLVDELAHTNVPGSRHVRRFQDVEEILSAGIDVYTTVNIQHLESLNDIVEQITEVKIRETVPDSILETADRVQLIDIPPEDLIKRLKEGKVYVPGQVERALKNFFRPGNINALREMALRFTAYRVDQQLNEYMHDHAIEGPWSAAEKVLVCVSASPFSAHLIRVAKRMASAMHAQWYAIHFDTPQSKVDDKARDRLSRNMRLAQELGANVASLPAVDIAEEIVAFCHKKNITHMVVGKPVHNRFWEIIKGGALVDRLIRKSGGIQIHVIQGKQSHDYVPKIETSVRTKNIEWRHYFGGMAMLGLMTLINYGMKAQLELLNVAMLYLLPVLLSAAWWGRGPSYVTAFCTVLVFDFLFVPPVHSFSVLDIRYLWSFLIFLLVAFVAGGRTERLRREAEFARQHERQTRALYEFSREIAAQVELDSIIGVLAQSAAQALERSVVVLLPDEKNKLKLRAQEKFGETSIDLLEEASELAVAVWAYEHGEVAGRSTDTLPASAYLYLPLNARDKTIGVLGLQMQEKRVNPEQRRLIEAWVTMASLAVERIHLTTEANHAALLEESERLRSALFNSISHELRTPLATILGSASTLLDKEIRLAEPEQSELLENIRHGAGRMERVVSNLLDTARLESGALQIKQDWCDIEDVIGAALQRLEEAVKHRRIDISLQEKLPLFKGDCVLLEQVMINLLDNALKYSPSDTPIELRAMQKDMKIIVSVADYGRGIPPGELEHIFEKFYRASDAIKISGTGLGLSICKGIVEAHGGEIWAANRPDGGVRISFALSLGKQALDQFE